MKLFKNQNGSSDAIVVAILGGIVGSLFILGVFVMQEIIKQRDVDYLNQTVKKVAKNITVKLDKQKQLEIDQNDNLSFQYCIKDLYLSNYYLPEHWQSDLTMFDYWKDALSFLYPDTQNLYPGSYCGLINNNKLISFSLNRDDGSQKIALFDAENNLLKETEGFKCAGIGEQPLPMINSINGDLVAISCSSGDAGHNMLQEYYLNINDFSFSLINSESSLDYECYDGTVNCFPVVGVSETSQYCTPAYREWARENCPGFKVIE